MPRQTRCTHDCTPRDGANRSCAVELVGPHWARTSRRMRLSVPARIAVPTKPMTGCSGAKTASAPDMPNAVTTTRLQVGHATARKASPPPAAVRPSISQVTPGKTTSGQDHAGKNRGCQPHRVAPPCRRDHAREHRVGDEHRGNAQHQCHQQAVKGGALPERGIGTTQYSRLVEVEAVDPAVGLHRPRRHGYGDADNSATGSAAGRRRLRGRRRPGGRAAGGHARQATAWTARSSCVPEVRVQHHGPVGSAALAFATRRSDHVPDNFASPPSC